MTWYTAHLVLRIVFKDGEQDSVPVMENAVLVSAINVDEAHAKAENIGFSLEGDSEGSLCWNDRPAVWKFVGVRKLLDVRNSQSGNDFVDDGSEVTFSTFEIDDVETLRQFMQGEIVSLKALD